MTYRSIEAAIPTGDRILLDTTVLIAYLNGNEPVSSIAASIFDEFVRSGRNDAIVSMVTVVEVLVRPLRQNADVYRQVLDFLQNFPHLRAIDIDTAVAHEAAVLRAKHNLAPADALIVATGLTARVSHFITNDVAWRSRLSPLSERVSVCLLGDFISPEKV